MLWSPECDGELQLSVGLVTHRHHAGVRLADAAAVVLLPGHGDS